MSEPNGAGYYLECHTAPLCSHAQNRNEITASKMYDIITQKYGQLLVFFYIRAFFISRNCTIRYGVVDSLILTAFWPLVSICLQRMSLKATPAVTHRV